MQKLLKPDLNALDTSSAITASPLPFIWPDKCDCIANSVYANDDFSPGSYPALNMNFLLSAPYAFQLISVCQNFVSHYFQICRVSNYHPPFHQHLYTLRAKGKWDQTIPTVHCTDLMPQSFASRNIFGNRSGVGGCSLHPCSASTHWFPLETLPQIDFIWNCKTEKPRIS